MSILKRKNNKGFTLIELLVVIGIISILGTVAVTAYVGSTLKATRSEAYGNLQALRMHEAQWISENSVYTANMGNFPSFNPGATAQYVYALNVGLIALPAPPVAVPYGGATVATAAQCFIATATGIAGTRVAGDVFAIDCTNNRNF